MSDFRHQVDTIKARFGDCLTASERRQTFMLFTLDMSYDRGAITTAMKECGLDNGFEITKPVLVEGKWTKPCIVAATCPKCNGFLQYEGNQYKCRDCGRVIATYNRTAGEWKANVNME